MQNSKMYFYSFFVFINVPRYLSTFLKNYYSIKSPTNAKNIAADAYRAHLNGSTVDWGSVLLRSTEDSRQMLREETRQLALKELG